MRRTSGWVDTTVRGAAMNLWLFAETGGTFKYGIGVISWSGPPDDMEK